MVRKLRNGIVRHLFSFILHTSGTNDNKDHMKEDIPKSFFFFEIIGLKVQNDKGKGKTVHVL